MSISLIDQILFLAVREHGREGEMAGGGALMRPSMDLEMMVWMVDRSCQTKPKI